MVADVPRAAARGAQARASNLLFEGAQGTLLDIDHGTYPYVTSQQLHRRRSRRRQPAWARRCCTTCWASPRPTPRASAPGRSRPSCTTTSASASRKRGNEFGATTGRARRCGWFDAAALKRSIQINGVSGLCVTKLDVLDGMETVRLCVGYKIDGECSDILPVGAEIDLAAASRCTRTCRAGATAPWACRQYDKLPQKAQTYLKRMEDMCEVPVDMVSTGPDREETIVRRHRYEA